MNRATSSEDNLPRETQKPEKRGPVSAQRCVTLNETRRKHRLRDEGSECMRGEEKGSLYLERHHVLASATQDPLS